MTKLKNNANRIIIAVLLCATLIFCTVMLCTNNAANVSADVPEGATESALLVEEEIEDNGNSLWDTQGYEVTREVGTVEIDGVTYDYTTKMRFSVYYNNLSNSSFGFLMADESSIPGLSSFGSGNFEDSTTDASIIDWRSGSSYKRKFRLVFGEDGAKVGKAILTRHVFSDDTTHDASTYLGTVRMLVEVVDTSTSFTFAADAVSAAGGYPHEILIAYATANANDSWNNAEGSRSYVSEFFNHIYINGKSLTEILDDGMKISVNFRRANIELWQCDSANEAVEFKAGDTLVFEKGLRMIEMDLNTNFAYVGQAGYKYVVLERTQEFTFDGTSWSADAYGIVGVNLDQTSSAVDLGDTLQLTATVVAGAKADDSVTFSSSDETVATVDETGLVTTIALGTAKITATASDGQTAECEITVVNPNAIASVTVDKRTATIEVGASVTVTPTVSGGSKADLSVVWSVDNDSVTVENGVITGVKAGVATVTVTSVADETKSARIVVTVKDKTSDDGTTTDPGDTDDGNDDNEESKGCGSAVTAASAIASALLLCVAVVPMVVRKKSER